MQQSWHYKDEATGTRVGPIDQGEVERLIAEGRLQRSTVVWNPQMADWAKAGASDLAALFGTTPPPLPAAQISRWALYTMALLPVWGTMLQAAVCSQLADPRAAFDSRAWILCFMVGNCLLGWQDEKQLERAGLSVKGGSFIALLLAPVYIAISCRAYHRHTSRAVWFAYAPLMTWILAFLLSAILQPYVFD